MPDQPDPPASDSEPASPEGPKGPVKIEREFNVDGKKMTVLVTLPAQVSEEIGLDNTLVAANRAIITLDTKNHEIEKIRRHDVGP